MLKYLVVLFLSQLSYSESDSVRNLKYEQAGRIAVQAALKQSGLEREFLNIQEVATTRVTEWFRINHLGTVVSITSAVVPVIVNKRVQFHTGDFSFSGTSDKKELNFIIGF